MALTITEKLIRCTDTAHTAGLAGQASRAWRVTWLPSRVLTRRQAVAAMSIAEEVGKITPGAGPEAYGDTFWTRVEDWAAELSLSGPSAVARASESSGRLTAA